MFGALWLNQLIVFTLTPLVGSCPNATVTSLQRIATELGVKEIVKGNFSEKSDRLKVWASHPCFPSGFKKTIPLPKLNFVNAKFYFSVGESNFRSYLKAVGPDPSHAKMVLDLYFPRNVSQMHSVESQFPADASAQADHWSLEDELASSDVEEQSPEDLWSEVTSEEYDIEYSMDGGLSDDGGGLEGIAGYARYDASNKTNSLSRMNEHGYKKARSGSNIVGKSVHVTFKGSANYEKCLALAHE